MVRIKQVAHQENTEEYVRTEDIMELTDNQLENLAQAIEIEQEARKCKRFAERLNKNMNYSR